MHEQSDTAAGRLASACQNWASRWRARTVGLGQEVPLLDGRLVPYVSLDNAASTPPLRVPPSMYQCPAFSERIGAFLERTDLASPFLVMDVAAVVSRYVDHAYEDRRDRLDRQRHCIAANAVAT